MKEESSSAIEIKGPQEEKKKVVVKKKDLKAEPSESREEVFCTSSKRALREAQIARALNFYKNSSFYRFKD
jgi:hypothetical protein